MSSQRGGSGARVLVLDDHDFNMGAATEIERALRAACTARGRAAIAVSGGGTPLPIYRLLATRPTIDWKSVRVFFADERCVSPDDPDSNHRALVESLLEPLGPRAPDVERMLGEQVEAELAAEHYSNLLPARLDLVVLGIGPDGHTASLFPGDREALESSDLVRAVVGPKPPPRRITLTPRAIHLARERIVLACGREKATTIRRVLESQVEPLELPAAIARDGIWILDRDAAAELNTNTENQA